MDDLPPPVSGCALVYHDAGWNPVDLPVHAKGPPPEGRTGYEGIDMTRAEIQSWSWNGNIGIRMPLDVIGLDVDAYRGGLESLHELSARLGGLPKTWISHNGRNDQSGIRFFRVPRKFAWVTSLPGIDIIQRVHRYAAAWPSVHPDGRIYGWWDQTIGAEAEVIPDVDDLPELPWPWIEELSRAQANQPTIAANGGQLTDFQKDHTRADGPGYLSVIASHFTDEVTAGRSRHDSMQHCLTWAMEHAAADVLDAATAIGELAHLWVRAVAPDSRRMAVDSPNRTTEFAAMLRHAVGKALAKSQDELHRLHDDAAGIGLAVTQEPRRLIDVYQTSDTSDLSDDLIDWVDWAKPHDPTDDLVEGLVIPGRWTQLIAERKEGKSTLILFTAVELSEGRDPLDGTPLDEPVVVAYCDGEMGESDLRELIGACGHDPVDLCNLHCAVEPMRLDTLPGSQRLLRSVDKLGAGLVILDGLNGFTGSGADENDVSTWTPFYELTVRPLKSRGIAILSGDNMGKDPTRGARGSSVKGDKADGVFTVKRTDKGSRLKLLYGRASIYADKLELEGEGFDRSKPIRYSRTGSGWPAGTKEAAKVLDGLNVPTGLGRLKVRAILRDEVTKAEQRGDDPEPFRIRNDALAGAIRWRKQPVKIRTNAPNPAGTGAGTGAQTSPQNPSGQVAGTAGTDVP